MDRESPSVTIDLLLIRFGGEDTVRLFGPTVRIPNRIWDDRPAIHRSRGLLNSLNPFAPDGLWRVLVRATTTREFIRERRRAKRNFSAK